MAGQRPLGIKILGGLFVIWGLISLITGTLSVLRGPVDTSRISVEMYRQQFFKNVPETKENIKKFEQMVPQFEKMVQAQKEMMDHPLNKIRKPWQLFTAFAWLILGIGLLMLKEKARFGTIVFQVVSTVVESIFLFIGYNIMMKSVANTAAVEGSDSFFRLLPLMIGLLWFVVSTLLIIWYLNRPKVKEQFV
jgi:hypothetical protein